MILLMFQPCLHTIRIHEGKITFEIFLHFGMDLEDWMSIFWIVWM